MKIAFVILGQPISHKNGYHIVTINKRPAIVKSKEAIAYEADALRQIPPACRVQMTGPVSVTMRIFYANERPDLDETLILDILQDRHHGAGANRQVIQRGVYVNDRQVREKHVHHGIDKRNPRCEIVVEPLQAQQDSLFAMAAVVPDTVIAKLPAECTQAEIEQARSIMQAMGEWRKPARAKPDAVAAIDAARRANAETWDDPLSPRPSTTTATGA